MSRVGSLALQSFVCLEVLEHGSGVGLGPCIVVQGATVSTRVANWRGSVVNPHNQAIKSVPGRRPSTGRPCQGAAYGRR